MSLRKRLIMAGGVLVIVVALLYARFQWRNTNFVHDPRNEVASAVIDGLHDTPMTRISDEWFIQYPTPEGHFDIVCKSGKELEAGYVTRFRSATLVMGPDCTVWETRR